ncbi:MAG: hypothetical protein ACE5LH_03950 [Fidelibacterota bacterium]
MRRFILPAVVALVLVPSERAFSLFGVGIYGTSDQLSVDGWSDSRFNGVVTLTGNPFEGALGVGGFLYIDAIPFVDLEASFEAAGQEYEFDFGNQFATLSQNFGWGRLSTYITLRRKLFGFGVPLLGGIKLHLGGGINNHNVTPLASIGMVEQLMGGDLQASFDPDDLGNELTEYLKNNRIEASGYHVQAGAQIKLLALNAFVNYRVTMATDVVPGADSFSSVWLGLAFGL